MIYGKWKLVFENNMGFGPYQGVKERGDTIEPIFFSEPNAPHGWVYGYLNDDFDFTGLDAWQITEITAEEILEQSQVTNPSCYFDDNGRITDPLTAAIVGDDE